MAEQRKVDFLFLITAILLAGIGIVMVYSSSMYFSMERLGDGAYFFKRQALRLLIGFLLMMFLAKVNYRGFEKCGFAVFVIGIALLIALLIQKVIGGGGVERWLRLGFTSFQPSEFMKIFIIMYLATTLTRMGDRLRQFRNGLLPMIGVIGLAFALVVVEPDLGTSGLIVMISFFMLFVAKAKFTHLFLVTAPGLAVVTLIVKTVPYMQKRVELFLEPSKNHQVMQSIIGIGSGGLFGVGVGNSTQKFLFLPERHTDFVFAIFAEETGLIGSTILFILLFFYVARGFKIAANAPDMYGFLLASGLSAMIGMQVLINIAVAIGCIPTTGMTLPFISYGGSSLLLSFIATGMLLNISKQANYEKGLSREFGARLTRRKVW